LEAFSYSVSHDLRTPLRAIDGFSQALWQKQASIGETGKHYLKRYGNPHRMSQLIEDLLNLSQVTRRDVKREKICLIISRSPSLKSFDLQSPEKSKCRLQRMYTRKAIPACYVSF